MKHKIKQDSSKPELVKDYARLTAYYDIAYEAQGKDYKKEADQIHEVIKKHKQSEGNELLDVACGTGGHFPYLKKWYSLEGLDIDQNMLQIARQRYPDITLHQGDMIKFDLGKQFDIVTCLFSAIGYAKTVPNLQSAVKSLAHHTKPGGVVIVEPWFLPEKWQAGKLFSLFVDKPDMKLARMCIGETKDKLSVFNFNFLVATPGKIEQFTELHEIGLYSKEDYIEAFEKAGLQTTFDSEGITGKGLCIGVK